MNALIDLFESLSGSVLPWALLLSALALAMLFGYFASEAFGFRRSYSSGGDKRMSKNKGSHKSDAMRAMSDLQMTWAAKRNYVDTLRAGPIAQGPFSGWFAEERELCESFGTAKKKLMDEQELREREHPEVQQRYLAIVNESERKPHSWLIYLGLFFLMAVEATGFALIFADRLSDTASAQAVQQYAIGISIVIAVFALYFADRIGRAVYRQGYAHATHLHAPGNSLARTTNRALGIEDESLDQYDPQSLRVINRSDFVNEAAAEARQKNLVIPRFPKKLWIYTAAVIAFGAIIFLVRLGQIDEFYAKEAQKEAAVATSERAASRQGNLSIPPGIEQSKAETSQAITQEALDKEKRGKQLAIGVFIAIFFIAQTLGTALAAARGFASNRGEEAFKGIRAFRDLHGDISLDQWKLTLKSETESADRYAQESLSGWQLGLQTAFTNKAMPVLNEVFFAQCASDFSHRTYGAYLQLKEHATLSTTRTIAAMQLASPLGYTSASDPRIAQPPSTMMPSPVLARHDRGSNEFFGESSARAAPREPALLVEYFVTSAGGAEQVERCNLAELQGRILRGQFGNLSSLNVRIAGQPGRFVPWVDFAEREAQT